MMPGSCKSLLLVTISVTWQQAAGTEGSLVLPAFLRTLPLPPMWLIVAFWIPALEISHISPPETSKDGPKKWAPARQHRLVQVGRFRSS